MAPPNSAALLFLNSQLIKTSELVEWPLYIAPPFFPDLPFSNIMFFKITFLSKAAMLNITSLLAPSIVWCLPSIVRFFVMVIVFSPSSIE